MLFKEHQPENAWSAVLSMSLCVSMLIAAEFMPVSLLTPIAADFQASEGQAGQAISISGFFAVMASLIITTAAGRLNRKWVLLAMTSLMLLSLILFAIAENFSLMLFSRALLGICIGGFWSLGAAIIMRLVEPDNVPKALSVMFAGQAVAAAFAAPIGSYLGGIIGWRNVFWILVPIVAINLIWQAVALPSLPANSRKSLAALFSVLKRNHFRRGILAVIAMFSGAFAMFTYLRPFLEQVVNVEVNVLSQLFLVLGVSGFIGTWAGGKFSSGHVLKLLCIVPVVMGGATLGLVFLSQYLMLVVLFLALWGIMNTMMPISWMSWMSHNMDDEAEAAGSLMVAAIQSAILMGAAVGGLLLDHFNIFSTFIGSIALLVLSLMLIGSGKGLLKPSNSAATNE